LSSEYAESNKWVLWAEMFGCVDTRQTCIRLCLYDVIKLECKKNTIGKSCIRPIQSKSVWVCEHQANVCQVILNYVMFECKDTRQIMYKRKPRLAQWLCVWVYEHQANVCQVNLNDVMFECKDTRQIMYKRKPRLAQRLCVWVIEHQANDHKQDTLSCDTKCETII
jgi:hypothetical protein